MAAKKNGTIPWKYLIAGLVILAFGVLYYLSTLLKTDNKTDASGIAMSTALPQKPEASTLRQETVVPEPGNLTQQQQDQQRQAMLKNEITQLKSEVAQHKTEIAQLEQAESDPVFQVRESKTGDAVKKQPETTTEDFEKALQQLISGKAASKSITFDKVYFDIGSAKLRPESQPQVAALARQLKANEQTKILLRGHSDNTGSIQRNALLSLSRSGSLRQAVAELGVDPRRITIEGVGSLDPVASNKTKAGREKNRRIELIIVE